LKRLAIHAIKAFNDGVREGVREGVTRDETEIDQRLELPPVVESGGKHAKHSKSVFGPVKQSKIARHPNQVDPLHPHSLGRSEGYGFLELAQHTDALRVLRWANNRSGVADLLWSWWKEELKEWLAKSKEAERKGLWERTLKEMEEEGFTGKDKPLLVEFAIENKVVTRMRAEKLVCGFEMRFFRWLTASSLRLARISPKHQV
jgi:nucleolar protein 4